MFKIPKMDQNGTFTKPCEILMIMILYDSTDYHYHMCLVLLCFPSSGSLHCLYCFCAVSSCSFSCCLVLMVCFLSYNYSYPLSLSLPLSIAFRPRIDNFMNLRLLAFLIVHVAGDDDADVDNSDDVVACCFICENPARIVDGKNVSQLL